MPFVIDVDPVAFTLLGIPVRWYGLIFVGAAALGVWLAQREGRRHGAGGERRSAAACRPSSRPMWLPRGERNLKPSATRGSGWVLLIPALGLIFRGRSSTAT